MKTAIIAGIVVLLGLSACGGEPREPTGERLGGVTLTPTFDPGMLSAYPHELGHHAEEEHRL